MSSMTTIDINVHPFQSDDLSILSFSDDITEVFDEVDYAPNLSLEHTETKTPLLEIEATRSVPVSDDESISEGSLFSVISLHSLGDKQSPIASCEEDSHPSMEDLVVKLNQSMMRSARSRAMVSTKVFADLKKQGMQGNKKQTVSASSAFDIKSSLRKVQKSTAKHTYAKNDGIARSSLLQFLRATKKW
ncbi:MAG: hypothetical protein SGBAC_003707 [Bacillariaceae sp.]